MQVDLPRCQFTWLKLILQSRCCDYAFEKIEHSVAKKNSWLGKILDPYPETLDLSMASEIGIEVLNNKMIDGCRPGGLSWSGRERGEFFTRAAEPPRGPSAAIEAVAFG